MYKIKTNREIEGETKGEKKKQEGEEEEYKVEKKSSFMQKEENKGMRDSSPSSSLLRV